MSGAGEPSESFEIFLCYSHKDERLLDRLKTHLSLLQRDKIISIWHDRRIGAGTEWAGAIDEHLNSARMILLLVSADFLASDYCHDVEMERALERHEAGEARVIPIILRPVDWTGAKFGKLQGFPKDAKPVTTWKRTDDAFLDIAKGIRRVAEELTACPRTTSNPFAWRGGITNGKDFFNRDREQGMLRSYLRTHQNCQVVGPRRIGKTSLLRQVERVARQWDQNAVVAYLDMQDARCQTLADWLRLAARSWDWADSPATLPEFADRLDAMRSGGRFAVLCLDEFERLMELRDEFTPGFLLNLRCCAQQGMSIITASQTALSKLTDPNDQTSPFYNTFSLLLLGPFDPSDAADFVTLHRPGIPPFSPEEKTAIRTFAKGHPLALQIACFHVVEAKQNSEELAVAIQKATDDMKALLRNW